MFNQKEWQKKWRKNNPEKVKQYKRDYYLRHLEQRKKHDKEYRLKNLLKCKKRDKLYRLSHKKEIAIKQKKYRLKHLEEFRKYQQEYRFANREKIRKLLKQYITKDKPKWRKYHRNYMKIRCQTDPLFKMQRNLGGRINGIFNRAKVGKQCRTQELLGASWIIIKEHIERQFTEGMSWNNYGRKEGIKCWEIDHIIPASSAKTKEELIKLCHYTNLQPLWSIDNIKKGKKYEFTGI
jgi:hypothetical protein